MLKKRFLNVLRVFGRIRVEWFSFDILAIALVFGKILRFSNFNFTSFTHHTDMSPTFYLLYHSLIEKIFVSSFKILLICKTKKLYVYMILVDKVKKISVGLQDVSFLGLPFNSDLKGRHLSCLYASNFRNRLFITKLVSCTLTLLFS